MCHPFFHHLGLTLIESDVRDNPRSQLFGFFNVGQKILPADSLLQFCKSTLCSSKSRGIMCLSERVMSGEVLEEIKGEEV